MEREKTNFSITCSLLSKYMKEKRRIGGLGLEIIGPGPLQQQAKANGLDCELATMNLLPGFNASAEEHIENVAEQQHENAENPHFDDPEKAQLTIFYSGELFVFDDFSAGMVEELMRMAKETSSVQNFCVTAPQFATSLTDHELKSSSQNSAVPRTPRAIASDIPLVRRNSLHRFLEKRKERINCKAPYQLNYSSEAKNAAKMEDNKSWLGLG